MTDIRPNYVAQAFLPPPPPPPPHAESIFQGVVLDRVKARDKAYKCNEYNSTFGDQNILNSHMGKHRKAETFECDLRGVCFKRKNHVRAEHKGNNLNKAQDYDSSQSHV